MSKVLIQIQKQIHVGIGTDIFIGKHKVIIDEAVVCGGITDIKGRINSKPVPQPKEVGWVNGDECEIDMTEGVRRYIFGCKCPNNQNTCIVFTIDGSGHMVMPIERLKKPESPEDKAKRERLEAAYDLYCESLIGEDEDTESFDEFKRFRNRMRQWLRIVDKTNYRCATSS